jgi:hypothetical protein
MKNQYDKELIINIIEQTKFLGLEGFYLEKLDKKFQESQIELKQNIDKIIVCLEWLDNGLGYFTYFAQDECLASEVREMIQDDQNPVIPLGCVITALLYFRNRIVIDKNIISSDLMFTLPYDERMDRERSRRICYEMDL